MTFKEKLEKERPESVGEQFIGGCDGCPCLFGYEPMNDCDISVDEHCRKCWNREIPEQSTASSGKVAIHASICSDLTALYERKHHDYGDSFGKGFAEYGMTMACIRLEDKLNRLKSLLKSSAQVDESIDDTLMELANYAIMTLIERKEN
ncbi:Nucleotide modification associated domain 1 [anaerobic digester metagenome]